MGLHLLQGAGKVWASFLVTEIIFYFYYSMLMGLCIVLEHFMDATG